MGEAKRRKEADPDYGRPTRGLIISSPIELVDGGFVVISAQPDPQDLRHALLFWDELVWPANRHIYFESGPDAKFLEDAKILIRPQYAFGPMKNAEPLIVAQIRAFKERDGEKHRLWDICQNSAVLLNAGSDAVKDGGIQIELLNAIPVPDKDVPLNEILEFKRKRRDEFLSLRAEIDSLVQSINSSVDPQTELPRKIAQVDKACSDALKISSEWQFPVRLSNQKATLDLKPFEIVAAGLSAYFGATALGLSGAFLAGLGGAAAAAKSSLKITSDIGWKGLKPRSTPFAYVARYNAELF